MATIAFEKLQDSDYNRRKPAACSVQSSLADQHLNQVRIFQLCDFSCEKMEENHKSRGGS